MQSTQLWMAPRASMWCLLPALSLPQASGESSACKAPFIQSRCWVWSALGWSPQAPWMGWTGEWGRWATKRPAIVEGGRKITQKQRALMAFIQNSSYEAAALVQRGRTGWSLMFHRHSSGQNCSNTSCSFVARTAAANTDGHQQPE